LEYRPDFLRGIKKEYQIMSVVIERIRAYSSKGEAGTELSEARLVEDKGLEGDVHAIGGEKQISLLFVEPAAEAETTEQKENRPEARGLCFSRFKENISLRGMASNVLWSGARLEAREAVMEITGETKHCYEECELFQEGKTCSLAGRSIFAKVLKSGLIRTGDRIYIK